MSEFVQALSVLELNIALPVLVILLIGILLIILSLVKLVRFQILAAFTRGVSGMILVLTGIIFLLLAFNIHTYQRLTYEKPVATLSFSKTGPEQYWAVLANLAEKSTHTYQLQGDEWQIDARILRWKPFLQLLGQDTLYRMERISGRYSWIDDEVNKPRTVYSLVNTEQGLDLWSIARKYQHWLNWLDAYYGSAAYLPMADGAIYTISINQSGIIARPENAITEDAISNWN